MSLFTSGTKKMKPVKSQIAVLFVLAVAFATPAVTNKAFAEPKGADDPMLKAMQLELDREKAQLVLPGMQRPYFIEYHFDDIDTYEAVANYGALTLEQANRQRIVRVTVRIGDYVNDSSVARGDGAVELAPKDNDPLALRYALWTATDQAYKNALRAYAAKQANLKRFQSSSQEHDFAPAKAVVQIEPLVALDIDRNTWKKRIVEASGLFASDPEVRSFAADVQFSNSNLRAVAVNRYLVNTEGTVVRQGYTGYSANVSVGGQAPDGMRLSRDNGTTAVLAKDLEDGPAFRKRVIEDLKSLQALRNAPVVSADDYHGPVLFSGDAAAGVFDRYFVPNIEADRPEAGTTARTQGAYSSSLHAQVLPETFNVVGNPTLTTFNGQRLMGAYVVDDEGVPAQSVDVVVNGKLQNFLIGRQPVRDFTTSNGHGRAAPGQAARSHYGVILIKSSQPLTSAAMTARLLALAKEQGHDVYAVDTLGGELAPRLLYRVHPDGSRDLVRGAVFDELDTRSLRSDIIAAGDDSTAYISNLLGALHQTTIAPSLLFGDIGVKRATEEQQKLPYYGPPALEGK
jgi:predicted Zn-dependent protease